MSLFNSLNQQPKEGPVASPQARTDPRKATIADIQGGSIFARLKLLNTLRTQQAAAEKAKTLSPPSALADFGKSIAAAAMASSRLRAGARPMNAPTVAKPTATTAKGLTSAKAGGY